MNRRSLCLPVILVIVVSMTLGLGSVPVRAQATSYDSSFENQQHSNSALYGTQIDTCTQYSCYSNVSYNYVAFMHFRHFFFRPFYSFYAPFYYPYYAYCAPSTYALSVSTSPTVGNAVSVDPLPGDTSQYSSSYYYSSPYCNAYGYYSYPYYGYPYYAYSPSPSYTRVTLTANRTVVGGDSTRHVFVSWVVDGSEVSGSNVQSVTMDRSHTMVARYKTQHMLRFSVNVPVVSANAGGWYDSDRTVDLSLPSPISISSNAQAMRYVLTGWRIDGSFSSNPTLSIRMDDPHSVEGIYTVQYYLKVTSEHGQPTGEGWYDQNSLATVSTQPELPVKGWWGALGAKLVFQGWSGDAGGASPTISVKMDGSKSLQAIYTLDQTTPILVLVGVIIAVAFVSVIALKKSKNSKFFSKLQSGKPSGPHENS